jgi:hypothetical protein
MQDIFFYYLSPFPNLFMWKKEYKNNTASYA